MARLVISDDTGKTQIFELAAPTVSIGRADVNDLVLNHPSISRYHARISVLPGGTVLLNDLGSLNGTYVNSQKVQEANLSAGDCISAGVYELRYEIGPATRLRIETGETVPGAVADLLAPETLASSLSSVSPAEPLQEVDIAVRLRDLEKENHLLKLLLGVGKTLSVVHTPEETLERVMQLVFQMENVERGFVMLRDEKKGFLPAVLLYKDEKLQKQSRGVALSQTVIDRVMKEKLPLLIQDVSQDERFRASESLRLSGVQSAMCAPLLYRDQVLGLFYVDCLSKVWGFTQEELGIFSVVAAEAAISLASAQSHQELAKRIMEKKALERFLDSAAVEKILANPDQISLGGESQKATILFSDLRGFTELSEKMEPAAVVELLNECFTEMTDLVFEQGGTLDKYTGDGLMVVFGAPLARPDDARRAVETAIAMQIALQRLNEHWEKMGRQPLRMGIGINTGVVTAGNIGSTKRMDYTVIGDSVNLASRLCANALPGQVLISASCKKDLDGTLPLKKLDAIRVKGREARVNIYEVGWQEHNSKSSRQPTGRDVPEMQKNLQVESDGFPLSLAEICWIRCNRIRRPAWFHRSRAAHLHRGAAGRATGDQGVSNSPGAG